MAIVHRATISPTKRELVTHWLDAQPWGGTGDVEMVGSYRFDDPAGEVGVESLLVRRGKDFFQLPLTYRGAPLPEGQLVTTMEHSVLGRRWIHLAITDPVGRECYVRSLLGEQDQAATEVYDGDRLVETRPPGVVVTLEEASSGHLATPADAMTVATDAGLLLVPFVLGTDPGGARRLVATMDGEVSVVVAVLDPS
jgi:hypothetical protein